MRGVVGYGAYLPYWRLERKAIGEALGAPGGGGTRSVAGFDEDTTSLGVEAARAALRGLRGPRRTRCTSRPPTRPTWTRPTPPPSTPRSTWPPTAMAVDMLGAVRSAAGALRAALDARGPALAVLADIRTGLPGGADEREGGDGAAAFLCGEDAREQPVLAEALGSASATAEFLDRWRLPGDAVSRQWEERFGEHAYVPLGEAALAEALKQAGVTAPALARLIVAGPHGRPSSAWPPAPASRKKRSPTISRPRSATRAPPMLACSWPMRSTGPVPTN